MPSKTEQLVNVLSQINMVAGGINPLIPLVGEMVHIVVGLLPHGDPGIKDFQTEVAKLDDTIATINANDAAWRAAHPKP